MGWEALFDDVVVREAGAPPLGVFSNFGPEAAGSASIKTGSILSAVRGFWRVATYVLKGKTKENIA